jgi:hypothetical protein
LYIILHFPPGPCNPNPHLNPCPVLFASTISDGNKLLGRQDHHLRQESPGTTTLEPLNIKLEAHHGPILSKMYKMN